MERYLLVNLLGPGPRLMKKEFTGAAVSQRFRSTAVDNIKTCLVLEKDGQAGNSLIPFYTIASLLHICERLM